MIRLCGFSLLLALLLPASAGAQQGFRFAWFTDTHVGGEHGETDLRAAIADVNSRTGIRFVLLSGDVTEMGSDEEVDRAFSAMQELRVPYRVLPGNHDTKWSPSGGTYLPHRFGADRFTFEEGGVSFIGLHQGPFMRMADGHWAPEDLRWLDSVVAGVGDRPLIFVTHYPIDSGISNWYEALERLKGTRVQAALVGHGHTNRLLEFDGVTGVMGRALIRDRQRPAGYTIVDCTQDSLRFSEARAGEKDIRPWAAIPRRTGRYTGPRLPRPDTTVNLRWPGVAPLWTVRTGWTIASAPAVAGDLCVVGTAGGEVRALSLADGVTRWSFRAGGPVYSTPAAAGGAVVFGSTDGCVYAVDAMNGALRWSLRTARPVVASPVIAGDTVFVGGSDGYVRAISLAGGSLLWRSDSIGGFVEARPAVTDSLVIVGAWDGFLYAFGRADGRIRWRWQGDRPGRLYAPAACTPVVAGGKVFVVAPDRAMTCLDLHSGRQVWRTRRHQVRESIGADADGRFLFVRTMRDSILCLDPAAPDARVHWTSVIGFGYDLNPAPPVVTGNTVFYGTMKGIVCALVASTGRLRWLHRTGVSLINPLVALDEHRVLVSDMNGVVQLLSAEEER